jgi:hypothetical protein
VEQERQLNQRMARRLAREMEQTHQGQWVGLVRGEVVATAPTLGEVIDALAQVESNPQRRFTFRVGEEFHKKLIILLAGR